MNALSSIDSIHLILVVSFRVFRFLVGCYKLIRLIMSKLHEMLYRATYWLKKSIFVVSWLISLNDHYYGPHVHIRICPIQKASRYTKKKKTLGVVFDPFSMHAPCIEYLYRVAYVLNKLQCKEEK